MFLYRNIDNLSLLSNLVLQSPVHCNDTVRYGTVRYGTVQLQYIAVLHFPVMKVCCHFVAAASRERERGGGKRKKEREGVEDRDR